MWRDKLGGLLQCLHKDHGCLDGDAAVEREHSE